MSSFCTAFQFEFSNLVAQVAQQKDAEIADLKAEIKRLKKAADPAQGAQVPATSH